MSQLSSLRRFVRPKAPTERCELCDAELAADHSHLFDRELASLLCACEACAVLFSGSGKLRYCRVPRRPRALAEFQLPDATWAALNLPINLAFFVRRTASNVVALCPGPAGITEVLVPTEAWNSLEEENPVLREFQPEIEGLLVNRIREAREYYRAGIDECYRLAGVIRINWRGLSGGQVVWEEIRRFFAGLHERT